MDKFQIGQWQVVPERNEIENSTSSFQLRPKLMQLLVLLAKNHGATLSRDNILDNIWPDRFGADEALSRTMSELRKALGDSVDIKTIPKLGYCLNTQPIFKEGVQQPTDDAPQNSQSESIKRPIKVNKTYFLLFALLLACLVIAGYFMFVKTKDNTTENTAQNTISVAILPLDNFTDSVKTGLIADGLVEELTHKLVGNPQIAVASRTSAFYFRQTTLPATEIGKKLSVTHILEGSIRHTSDGYRITSQLVETTSGFHVWSETFDSQTSDLIDVQEQVATQIKKLVGQTFAPSNFQISNEDYETYLLGLEAIATFGPDNLQLAETYFNQVLANNPSYQPAKIGLANTIIAQLNWGQVNEELGFYKAEILLNEVAANSTELTSEYYLARGLLYSPKAIARKNTDREKARKWFEKALEYAPNDSRVLALYTRYVSIEREKATELLEKALKLDPYNPELKYAMANREILRHETALRIKRGNELVAEFPDSVYGYAYLADVYNSTNNYLKLYVSSYQCLSTKPEFMDCWAYLMSSLIAADLVDEASQIIDVALQYAPSLRSEFSILKSVMQADRQAVIKLAKEIDVARLNPRLSYIALLWAISQTQKEQLASIHEDFYQQQVQGNYWHQKLYQYQWMRYKNSDLSYQAELIELIEEIENYVNQANAGHRWLLAALALNDEIDRAFTFAKNIPEHQSIANFFSHYHLSTQDPFLQPLHTDPRWQLWLEQQQASQERIKDSILATQKQFPLSGLLNLK